MFIRMIDPEKRKIIIQTIMDVLGCTIWTVHSPRSLRFFRIASTAATSIVDHQRIDVMMYSKRVTDIESEITRNWFGIGSSVFRRYAFFNAEQERSAAVQLERDEGIYTSLVFAHASTNHGISSTYNPSVDFGLRDGMRC